MVRNYAGIEFKYIKLGTFWIGEWVFGNLSGGSLKLLLYLGMSVRVDNVLWHGKGDLLRGMGVLGLSKRMYYIYFKELVDGGVLVKVDDGFRGDYGDDRKKVVEGHYMVNPRVFFESLDGGSESDEERLREMIGRFSGLMMELE